MADGNIEKFQVSSEPFAETTENSIESNMIAEEAIVASKEKEAAFVEEAVGNIEVTDKENAVEEPVEEDETSKKGNVEAESNSSVEKAVIKAEEFDIKDTVTETKEPPVEIVFATVLFDNSDNSQLTSEESQVLSSILKCKDHLCRNIASATYANIQTYHQANGKFGHSMNLEVNVKTGNL